MNRKTVVRPPAFVEKQTEDTLLGRAKRYVRQKDYVAALQMLGNGGHDPEVKNARGVCLLRMGRYTEALQFYRGMLLRSGCIVMRPELPTYLKANYATALLLIGQTEGCVQTLTEANDDKSPIVMRLNQNLKRWEKGLTLGQWLLFKFGALHSPHALVPIDFLPGVFEDGLIEELPAGAASPGGVQ
ncbi:tetratricopeptide repeat protein [Blastopirellula sp. JC732]|uniref:Tetratricopeptide repeat protein n=1 Tax=Blastopirellula sediminis TaxID=2894196 RepID=A0A9X1SIL3_9BACT|nr:tetratricopeptide repeat protein [Blastopirellula sediminis]MCC9605759.1 tetratricopeptide repeat protein [Blastopirellula sediminis]MCC9630941.1 tetratricopeptide repeat protein [Blastopirellula sediminis]